jgi:general secretion pathway protein D
MSAYLRRPAFLLPLAMLLLLCGCAAERLHSTGLAAAADGRLLEGVSALRAASEADPANTQYRTDYLATREHAVVSLLAQAEQAATAGKEAAAEALYRDVQRLEPSNRRAAEGLDQLSQRARARDRLSEAREALQDQSPERAQQLARAVLEGDAQSDAAKAVLMQAQQQERNVTLDSPKLQAAFHKPVSLQFKDANLRVVLDGLSRATGVDFILDRDVRPDLRTSVALHDAPLADALALILQTNGLERKVLGPHSILIYANTPDKQKEYQELVVKGFYLANADVNKTQALIKSMLKTKDTFIDEKLNLLVIRDTPEAIRLAEKLIAMQDLAEPEVMLDVEVLEVKRSRLNELGIQWTNQFSVTPLVNTPAALSDLRGLNADRLGVTVPNATVNLRRELGDANILASPRIRARNREKARVMIGDKLPVTTNTTTATGLISESVQYLDVGIKLEAEPNVYLHGDVAIKIGLEVSTVVNEVRTPGGALAYQVGTRSASTVLRLKDGETQILAGLISDEERSQASRIPALGDLPLIGRLFGSQKNDHQKTEIVLSITPHLIRNVERAAPELNEFWSGTEAMLSTRPVQLAQALQDDASAAAPARAADPAGAITQRAPTKVSLSWEGDMNGATVGKPLKLALRMQSDGGLRGLPLQLGFDPARLEILDIAEGDYFRQGGVQTSMSSHVDADRGRAMVSIVRSGTDGTKGDLPAVVVTVKPLRPGPATVAVLSAVPAALGAKPPAISLPAPASLQVAQ